MSELPSGTVTFFLTDIEGSTRLWELDANTMAEAVARHDDIIAKAVAAADGLVLKAKGEGDSIFAVFGRATDAVAAALGVLGAMATEPWPAAGGIGVRAALHTGEVAPRDGDYYGPVVNRAARLRALAHGGQVLVSQATAELVREQLPRGASLSDLGVHRLRDLSMPERVFQLCHPEHPMEFPRLASLDVLPHNLPVQLTSFVGREADMGEVYRLLGQHRLLTLTGAAGCGKTRLALQVAADMVAEVPDGVWFVDLASLADASLVLPAVAQALGIPEAGQGLGPGPAELASPLPDVVARSVCTRDLVILLDNCEHLVSAAGQVAELMLRAGPSVRVLCTSREALGVGAETAWRVPSLVVPDPHHLPALAELAKSEGVGLFVERAAQRQADFTLTVANAPAVAQICQRLDGIPLAIELAAARAGVLTPGQIASRLDDRFALLTGGSRSALERHQTLRAAVDWSYETLSEPERALLRRASVFAGGFSLEAAEAVCTGDGVGGVQLVELIGKLIDKSLLTMAPHHDRARYRFLETIRQYGAERLVSAGEVEERRTRHQEFFLAAAEAATRRTWGPDAPAVMAELDEDAENFAQAAQWAMAREDWGASLGLMGALERYWLLYRTSHGRQLVEEVLQRGPKERTFDRARVLAVAGMIAGLFRDGGQARVRLEESLSIFRELGVRRGTVWSLLQLANLDLIEDRLDEMAARLDEALPLARAGGHAVTLGWALNWKAELAARRGDYEMQRVAAAEAVDLLRSADAIGTASALAHLAYAEQGEGNYADSVVLLEEAAALGIGPGPNAARLGLGQAALATGDLAAARAYFQERLDAARERSMHLGEIWALINMAEVDLAEGHVEDAARCYQGCFALCGETPPPNELSWLLAGAAKVAAWRGAPVEAASLLGAAQGLRGGVGIERVLPVFRNSEDACAQRARDALGDAAYEEARGAGLALPADVAVSLARSVL